MSLSFSDSLKQITEENEVATAALSQEAVALDIDGEAADPSVMTLDATEGDAAYEGEDGNWIQHQSYRYYPSFSDENLSTIDGKKNIIMSDNQLNVAQEENSQYIPFEMPRYYDGFDLASTELSIHYETSAKRHDFIAPINVTYNDEKIRFGWLVDAKATKSAGRLKFEIHANGEVYDSDGNSATYLWKTKYCDALNVYPSLCTTGCPNGGDDEESMDEDFSEITDAEVDSLFK